MAGGQQARTRRRRSRQEVAPMDLRCHGFVSLLVKFVKAGHVALLNVSRYSCLILPARLQIIGSGYREAIRRASRDSSVGQSAGRSEKPNDPPGKPAGFERWAMRP